MIRALLSLVAVLASALTCASPAAAIILGGGSKKADCYAAWEVNSPEVAATKGTTFQCVDGDACDADGAVSGGCTFKVAVCVNQADPSGKCTPQPLTSVSVLTPPVTAPTDLTTANCSALTSVTVALKPKKGGKFKKAKTKLKMVALSSGKPKKDTDKLTLLCLPNPSGVTTTTIGGGSSCAANPQGGPSELKLTIVPNGTGGDLDNGWNGGSHNFPVVGSAVLDFCLTGCDGSAGSECTGTGATGAGTTNGAVFGSPLPLLASTPVCVVNRFDDSVGHITLSSAKPGTGEMTMSVHLLSDVYITDVVNVCPQCSGSGVGASGVCRGGRNDNKACVTRGTVPVSGTQFNLSPDCPPSGQPGGILTIALDPLTTGTSHLDGPKPCPGQLASDACPGGGTCTNANCTGNTAQRGGIPQLCCSNQPTLACFPSADSGTIARTGSFTALTPAGSFPASSSVVLASVFCEPATTVASIDGTAAGLPGPGALLQPMTAEWIK